MRFTFIACVLAATLGAVAQAQLSSRPGLSETARRLSDAVDGKQEAQATAGSEGGARSTLSTLAEKAGIEFSTAQDPANAPDQKRITEALQNLSPEGKALLAQNVVSALRPADSKEARGESAAAGSAAGEGPRPKPLTPEPLAEPAPAKPPQRTIITGDEMFFDSAKSIAVFVGNVVVDSPQFHITCDEFEVHMRKQEKEKDANGKPIAADAKGGKPASGKAAAPKPDVRAMAVTAPAVEPGNRVAADGKANVPYHDDSIEAAIAKGRKVVIIKHNPDGKVQIGQSRYAYYDGDTGDITLKHSPQVQDGDNLHTAVDETTVMIMTQAGALHTTGRSTTNLVPAKNDTAPGATPATAPGTVPAPGGAVKTPKGFSIPAPGQ